MRDTSAKTPQIASRIRAVARLRKRVQRVQPEAAPKAARISAGAIAGVRANPAHLIGAIREGLFVEELSSLRSALQVSTEQLLPMIGLSKATFHRRKATGRLDAAESDRVVRLARLIGLGIEVMESDAAARLWLTSPQAGLGGGVPLDYAKTEVGAREVEDLLGRIDFGVY